MGWDDRETEAAVGLPPAMRRAIAVLGTLLALSLLLHLWTFYTLYRTRTLVRNQLALLGSQVEEAQTSVARFEVPINQDVPINTTVPFDKTFNIPISTTVAISDYVDFPLFGAVIPVPVQFNAPVSATVPISVSTTFDLSTTIRVDLTVPIDVAVSETPLAPYLKRLREALAQLEEEL